MTNYMGRARLEKILFKYISDRPDLIKSLRVAAKEYGKEMIFVYRKFRGSEWLECQENGYTFKVYADGSAGKMVDVSEYFYDEKLDEDIYLERIVTYYNKDFNPVPEETWFSGAVAGVKARKDGVRPFKDGNTTYNGIDIERFICNDISKKSTAA